MPVINILFWLTLLLAALMFWRIYAYMMEAEKEAEKQYQDLLKKEHMYNRRSDGNYNYQTENSYKRRIIVPAAGIKRVGTNRKRETNKSESRSNYRRSHRTVA